MKIWRRLREWDWLSKVALVLCFADSALVFSVGPGSFPDEGDWSGWFAMLLSGLLAIPWVGAPQVGMLVLMRLGASTTLRWLYFLASVGMVGLFYRFLTGADFTGSSTAAVAIMFVPLYLAGASFVLGVLVMWLQRRLSRKTG